MGSGTELIRGHRGHTSGPRRKVMELVAREMLLGTAPIGVEQFSIFKGQLMESIAQLLRADRDSDERTAMKLSTLELMRAHMWIPSAATAAYVVMVHMLPLVLKNRGPLPLGWLLGAWNFFLATFSFVGAAHCVSCLVANVLSTGWRYSICTHPTVIALQGTDMDVWTCYFVLSKLFEFGDTALKIGMKKRVSFLHWFHHAMTCWIGWFSLASAFAPGMWYSAVNFAVHGPMYTYYFFSSVLSRDDFKRWISPFARFITIFQIIQMCTFLVVNGVAFYFVTIDPETCHISSFNLYLNASIVAIYLLLFVSFFISRFLRPRDTSPKAEKPLSASKSVAARQSKID